LNLYAYVHNDPVNFIDPSGLDGVDGGGQGDGPIVVCGRPSVNPFSLCYDPAYQLYVQWLLNSSPGSSGCGMLCAPPGSGGAARPRPAPAQNTVNCSAGERTADAARAAGATEHAHEAFKNL